jgi:UDP-glucuronate 4-epimerase
MKILVTGAAGFVGNAVSLLLAERGDEVVGLDNLNSYYDPRLKERRLERLQDFARFRFVKMDLADAPGILRLCEAENFDAICHLGAQAGVRYSLENPHAYIESNVVGHLNILEAARKFPVKHLVYASSSSVYGENAKVPFATSDAADSPVSLYAATKRADELMSFTYSHLFGIRATGLRFFTVYGPWGRPDMAPMLFADAIVRGRPIRVFNNGQMMRDFTYISDIALGTVKLLDHGVAETTRGASAEATVFNIGRGEPVDLMRFIEILEDALGKKAIKEFLPMQPGDVPRTWADTADLERVVGYRPQVGLEEGVRRFAEWFGASM